jgi:hypothetical protein
VDDARLCNPAATSHRWKCVGCDEGSDNDDRVLTLYVQDLVKVPGLLKLQPIYSRVDTPRSAPGEQVYCCECGMSIDDSSSSATFG